jgi:hypothetical protein
MEEVFSFDIHPCFSYISTHLKAGPYDLFLIDSEEGAEDSAVAHHNCFQAYLRQREVIPEQERYERWKI